MGYLTNEELIKFNFKKIGKNVKISDKCSIYNSTNIEIGNNVRIDDFCVISAGTGGIEIKDFVHLSLYVSIQGSGKITLGNYVGCAPKVSIISTSDDYSGEFMTNPQVASVDSSFTKPYSTDIYIGNHCIIGMNSIVLPNSYISDGISIGAMSMVNRKLTKHGIYFGIPVKFFSDKNYNYQEVEKSLLEKLNLTEN